MHHIDNLCQEIFDLFLSFSVKASKVEEVEDDATRCLSLESRTQKVTKIEVTR